MKYFSAHELVKPKGYQHCLKLPSSLYLLNIVLSKCIVVSVFCILACCTFPLNCFAGRIFLLWKSPSFPPWKSTFLVIVSIKKILWEHRSMLSGSRRHGVDTLHLLYIKPHDFKWLSRSWFMILKCIVLAEFSSKSISDVMVESFIHNIPDFIWIVLLCRRRLL